MNQRDFFDNLAGKWDSLEREDIGERLVRVVTAGVVCPGHRVLDVGTGTGILIQYLLDAVEKDGHILAMDISSGMLQTAKRKGFPANVEFLQADIQESGLPESRYDRVFCNAVFPHFDDKLKALSEIRRLLRPGGRLVISHPIGRETVNNLHRDAGGVVAEDRVPPAEVMIPLLETTGFTGIRIIDEPNFHLVLGDKPLYTP
ncbi:MAG: class I SAM-dependent methyltransferase [bacterium]|nr:class I SAM-dependent methyltransferase [bacterium]